ncbi:P-loop containing nucleoside triphosphate hydrolase protein [Xylariomycetidae sp. FL2044]|nr:P-loop containing nucleoside triphosphate hydrolase protein [Xylariomycetidae sp. FL2044]
MASRDGEEVKTLALAKTTADKRDGAARFDVNYTISQDTSDRTGLLTLLFSSSSEEVSDTPETSTGIDLNSVGFDFKRPDLALAICRRLMPVGDDNPEFEVLWTQYRHQPAFLESSRARLKVLFEHIERRIILEKEDDDMSVQASSENEFERRLDGLDDPQNHFYSQHQLPTVGIGSEKTRLDHLQKDTISLLPITTLRNTPTPDTLNDLTRRIQSLQSECSTLKEQVDQLRLGNSSSFQHFEKTNCGSVDHDSSSLDTNVDESHGKGEIAPKQFTFKDYHIVICSGSRHAFHDMPRKFKGDRASDHIRGALPIDSLEDFLTDHPDILFGVCHEYECSCRSGPRTYFTSDYRDGRLPYDSHPARSFQEHILISEALKQAIQIIAAEHRGRFGNVSRDDIPSQFQAPYNFFYSYNRTFLELMSSSGLTDRDQESLRLLCTWFEDNCSKDWNEADALISRGKINGKHYDKLFRPNDLVLNPRKEDHNLLWVYRTPSYPWSGSKYDSSIYMDFWEFNGTFRKSDYEVHVQTEIMTEGLSANHDIAKDITSLRLYPLRFAHAGARDKLVNRGHKFWSCRLKRLVAYNDPSLASGTHQEIERRFMVDYSIYRILHPTKEIFENDNPKEKNMYRRHHSNYNHEDDLDRDAMEATETPSDDILAMLPPVIHAFDLSTKVWQLIQTERITDVTWNKDAFKQLVIPADTRELVEAAVTMHGSNMKASPDIIAGKGQGLLILLHGGPGTGKTLTAESIAEAQERPLYRVTCGDIGTDPAEAEQYLQTVLIIGKAWGCVVLLDEADVFLEERNIADREQNAFVSVFLRVLEYYDGILVLTTNRVGTFDEAFKSRIHLALHYPNLDEEQRLGIWQNLFAKLRRASGPGSGDERVDVDDLLLNVHKLARIEINGRQIRNVITMARYLAKFRRQMLVYRHVQDAVASVVKFDEYLDTLRGSDDRWARESRLR